MTEPDGVGPQPQGQPGYDPNPPIQGQPVYQPYSPTQGQPGYQPYSPTQGYSGLSSGGPGPTGREPAPPRRRPRWVRGVGTALLVIGLLLFALPFVTWPEFINGPWPDEGEAHGFWPPEWLMDLGPFTIMQLAFAGFVLVVLGGWVRRR